VSTLEECNALVAEFWVAYTVAGQLGVQFSGRDLLRFRQLPPLERVYFEALVAPIVDGHASTRTQTVSEPDASGHCSVTYDPPYPEPCACKSRLFLSQYGTAARCSRCLRAWPLVDKRVQRDALNAALLTQPLIESVLRDDMAHAIDHFEWKSEITAFTAPKPEAPVVNPWRAPTPDDCPGRLE